VKELDAVLERFERAAGFPAVVWTDPVGNRRWSPMLAFETPSRALTGIAAHHAACVQRLRKWARHQ